MGAGRPKDSVIDRLKEGWQARFLAMGKEGCSDVEIRAEFGISDDLWYRWIAEDEEFSRTYKLSKAACHAKWEEMGRKMAFGQVEGNPTTWIFNMKNRFNWRDKQDVDHSGQIDLSAKTDDELKARAAKLLSKVTGE
ncbi:terminase small subunit [Pseudomonas phage AH02]|nr:terminase small subunit [Pseudomonas phage AH02]